MSYQYIPGITKKSERGDCQERWNMIKPLLPKEGVLLDIGTAEGFFLKKIAEETNLLAVGVEQKKNRAFWQYKWLNDSHKGKIVSCCFGMNREFSDKLMRVCDFFDITLILSTLHWINSDEFLKNISRISGKVIIEIPELDDYNATGQNFLNRIRRNYGNISKYLNTITGRKVDYIGKVKAHTSKYRSLWLINGDYITERHIPHLDFEPKCKTNYKIEYSNNRVHFFKDFVEQSWTPGINLLTLKKMNIIFPKLDWWKNKIDEIVGDINKNCDKRIHNVIVARDKLFWIDINHHKHKNTIYEDIKELVYE